MEPSASSPALMEEELDTSSGMRASAMMKTETQDARRTDFYGIQDADKTSIQLVAVFALLIALLDKPISASHAQSNLTVAQLVHLLAASQDGKCTCYSASPDVKMDSIAPDTYAGRDVPLASTTVELLSALILQSNVHLKHNRLWTMLREN